MYLITYSLPALVRYPILPVCISPAASLHLSLWLNARLHFVVLYNDDKDAISADHTGKSDHMITSMFYFWTDAAVSEPTGDVSAGRVAAGSGRFWPGFLCRAHRDATVHRWHRCPDRGPTTWWVERWGTVVMVSGYIAGLPATPWISNWLRNGSL